MYEDAGTSKPLQKFGELVSNLLSVQTRNARTECLFSIMNSTTSNLLRKTIHSEYIKWKYFYLRYFGINKSELLGFLGKQFF